MILQELVRLYDRLDAIETDGHRLVPTSGFSAERVSFCIVIDRDGRLVAVEDIRDQTGAKPQPVPMDVPQHTKRPGIGVSPFFLCDNSAYLLGADAKDNPERAILAFQACRDFHRSVAGSQPGESPLHTVARFLETWDPARAAELDLVDEIVQGSNLVFRIDGTHSFVHEAPSAIDAWRRINTGNRDNAAPMTCLVTGERATPAKLHPAIKGIAGGNSTGTSVVSFNLNAFRSFGKERGMNAPVSESAAFRYVTALNYLTSSTRNRIRIADTTVVFWAERETRFENVFGVVMEGLDEEPDEEVRADLLRLRDGKPLVGVDPEVRFFVLGLAPNAARLSVRFWLTDTVGAFAAGLAAHLADCAIERQYESEPETIPIWRLVSESARRYTGTGRDRKAINVDPNPKLAAGLTRAVLTGVEYPSGFLATYVGRVRADGEINYQRASAIKAAITRSRRKRGSEEVTVALDKQHPSVGYRLGRLFAALERAQYAALGDVNATIKDRYYGAASSTPARVFPILMRLSQHHIAKAEWGGAVERVIAEIVDGVREFPAFLPLEEQGLFAIGYYHQRNDFFRKKTEQEDSNG